MQNFTLRFKGKIFYLFALALFMVSMSSYGQCPTVNDSEETFCYLSTVSDLNSLVTPASGKTLRFYRTQTSTNPIPNDELLETGPYYAGNQDNSCRTSNGGTRPESQVINVTVDDLGAPTSNFGNFYEPCVYEDDDVTTVGDLKDLITPSNPNYDLNVYAEEFGDMNDELLDTYVLVDGENYFVGQDDPADADCRYSSRIAIEYNPVEAFAPTAEPIQEFCESDDPTVADLTASSSNPNFQAFRFYSTSTSQPPLDPSTPLVDGEDYYVSQIVNRTNSTEPPCESTARAKITVNLLASDAGPDNTDNVLCVSQADGIFDTTANARDFFLTLLSNNFDSDPDNDVPTNGSFSADILATIVTNYSGTKVGTYQTTYTVDFGNGCEDSVILGVTVEEDPNPGVDTALTYCQSDAEALISQIAIDPSTAEDTFADLLGPDVDLGGTFSITLEQLAAQFAIAVENNSFPATFETTYTVTVGDCTDSAKLTLNILPDPDAGEDSSATLCENEVIELGIFANEASLQAYLLDLLGTSDDSGSFDSLSLTDLITNYNNGITQPSEDFTTTYTIDNGACAPVMATATLTVTAAIPAEAGTGTSMTYCSNDPVVNLATLLTGANPDGVFSSDDANVADGTFNPSVGEGSYSIIYTVSPETACVTNTATANFTITVEDAPDAGSSATVEFCETDAEVMTAFADEDALKAYLLDFLGTDDDGGDFDPLLSTLITNYDNGIDGAEDFSTTYTIAGTAVCDESTATASITINEAVLAEAGTIDNVEDICSNDPVITLSDYLTDPATVMGGRFSSDDVDVADGTFDPSTAGVGTFTITYTISEDDACVTGSSFADFTIMVDQAPNAGPGGSFSFCQSEFETLAAQVAANPAGEGIELLNEIDPTITAGGDFTNSTLAQLLAQYAATTTFPATFTTTYTVGSDDNDCTDSASYSITINPNEEADAGDNQTDTFCTSDGIVDLSGSIDSEATTGGIFTSDDLTITDGSMFDAAAAGAGTFTVTYTVDGTSNPCVTGTSTSTITITVNQGPNAGPGGDFSFCQSEFEALAAQVAANPAGEGIELLNEFDPTITPGGDFTNSTLSQLLAQYSATTSFPATFTTTYTVSNDDCTDSADYSVTINPNEDADAGDDQTDTFCTSDGIVDLSGSIDSEATTGGIFTSDDLTITDGSMFDAAAAGAGTFTVTYTVDGTSNPCVTGTSTSTITITVNQGPNAGPGGDFSFCQSEFEALAALVAANPAGEGIELLNEIDPTITPGGDFTNSTLTQLLAQYSATTSFPATFTTTYTVSNDDCTDSASYSITINPNEEADAGDDRTVSYCTTSGVVDLADEIGAGTFTSDDLTITGGSNFDATAAGAGTYTVNYTVDGTTNPCVDGTDAAIITVVVTPAFELGDDVTTTVCTSDLEDDYFTLENLTAEFTDLLPDDAPNGIFSPAISDLVDDFNDGMTTGDFTTTYTIGTDDCKDSVSLTISVLENIEADLTDVDDPDPICQNAGIQQLTDFIGDNPDRGVFEGYDDGTFNPAMMAAGDYEITYTLSEDSADCVTGSASVTFTISVLDSANAGEDVELTVCQSSDVQNLFDSLTGDFTDTDGTFILDGDEIANGMMNPADFDAGTYTVMYTVTAENDCGNDSATFTVTVNEAPDAGEDFAYTVCTNVDSLDLNTLLDDDVTEGGSFEYDGNTVANGIINPGDFEPGDYTIGYILLNNDCSDIAVITLSVQKAANAGEDMDIEVCMSDDVQNLFDFVSVDADMDGTFSLDDTEVTDGMMDPADFEAGTYTILYTVAAINDCGDDTSEFTVIVQETPEAPTVTDQTFCAIDGPTGAQLVADGSNLTFYSDETLETMVDATTALTTGAFYVTQRADDGTCESMSAIINVTVNDAATPTIDSTSQTFCEFDDATVQTLADLINETGVTFYDAATGGATISPATALQNGVTYYASLTDAASGCESSSRLAINVTVETCPLIFPEGFSPNGDGLNDTFTIKNIEREYPNYSMEIHNRWGDMVYKGNDDTPDWDGYSDQSGFGNDLLPVGAYFYIIYFNDGSTPPRRGTVYLSR
ncbi:gliding motility-associated C-terminal domain-containing protein [Gramella sp. AN32]|uniref:Gliding motility-associated C-terminal domain-containing protein n=1 Tax=Christiangramia antarctica TaxID=2058158 RepID=A0ABW5X5F3_9FLAO|nr:gliding motility-associated C-terminal domain-containing protein [Gramella sp. AN32]MCM4157498.1 hypothetical protein [Gramella sp. AN32]